PHRGRGGRAGPHPSSAGLHEGQSPARDRAAPGLARDVLPTARGVRAPQEGQPRVAFRRSPRVNSSPPPDNQMSLPLPPRRPATAAALFSASKVTSGYSAAFSVREKT